MGTTCRGDCPPRKNADGSTDPITGNAGAGAFCQFFQLKKPVGFFVTILMKFFVIKTISHLIENERKIVLQWIPSHGGIPDNEEVDALAKSAMFLSLHHSPLPLRNCKSLIKIKFKVIRKLRHSNIAAGKSWVCLLKNKNRISLDLPRRICVACFRMR
ncbi:hypothetical protein CEXT_709511 [Caerostris extrusa]|uniref:RNase H type-1 domain-containing protein n=1 Tax=Caerostris extrusa TaxID=172846 RepID=A0AAV4UL31_CAEEX|nr:hypothetical protein CEXT_709511 [Caerostris extrusa]